MTGGNHAPTAPGPLPEALIEGGWRLLERLDAEGHGPRTAFWLWFPDVEGWRLMFAGGSLLAHGPRATRRRLRETLEALGNPGGLTEDHLGVAKPGARSVKLIEEAIHTGPGIHGIHIKDNVVAGRRIRRAYVYRVM